MMEIKDLTEWFPRTVRPNFVGVYEIQVELDDDDDVRFYSYWSGSGWLPAYLRVEKAYRFRNTDPLSYYQDKVWRGLSRPIE